MLLLSLFGFVFKKLGSNLGLLEQFALSLDGCVVVTVLRSQILDIARPALADSLPLLQDKLSMCPE